ncbi:MAG: hypothetical protein GX270_14690 [Clostridiaceae bacterium]|nr:hypothetical protein [Clostridiaceae bacterium]
MTNDILATNTHGNYLYGHSGDDTYIINIKSGVTLISDYCDYNSVRFGVQGTDLVKK